MTVTLLGSLLLVVSLVSVLIYMYALGQLLVGERQPGLVRTGLCRLFAALLYVGVGLLTLETNKNGPLVGLGVFTAIQLMWQMNSVADVRLARKKRAEGMNDPLFNPSYPEPVPNMAPPLSAAVISAEIDRLSSNQTTLGKTLDDMGSEVTANSASRRYAIGGIIFTGLVGVVGLVFGLIVFNRADRADALSQQNAQIIAELKATQAELKTSVHEQCSLDDLILGTYNPRAKPLYPAGPDAYDDGFRRILLSSQHQRCNIATPKGLTE